MLEISVLVLILQIGLNAALNYRGHNQNPLIPSSRLLNYGQSRRLLNSNRYLPLRFRRNLPSDIDQSESEDSSFEEASYRRLHSLQRQNLPYHRRSSLRYNTRTDNDVSLELPPIGRMNPNNYADIYPQVLSATSQAETNFRRPYLRNRPTNLGQVQNRNLRNGDDMSDDLNDFSLEESDRKSPVDNLPAARKAEDTSYLRSLLSLIEIPTDRRNQNRKYYKKEDNDLSLEVSVADRLNPDHDSPSGVPSLRTSHNDNSLVGSLLSGLRQLNYRRANVGLEKSINNKLNFADNNANSNSLRSHQPNLKLSNNRRNNRNYNRKEVNSVRFDMQYPDKNTPDAYIDTILLASDDSKPDDIVRPQLRSVTYNDNYNRKNNAGVSLEVSSNERLNSVDDISSNLSGFYRQLRSRKPSNNNPNANEQSNRRHDNNVDLELLSNDRLSSNDDTTNNISFLRLVNLDDLNLESSQLRSRNKKLKNLRRDDDDFLTLSSNDRLSHDETDADAALNLADFQSESLDEYNLVPPNMRSIEPLNQKNKNERDNDDARRELLLNDRVSADDDSLSNLSVLRLVSSADSSVEFPLLRRRDSSTLNGNYNLRTRESDNNRGAIELLFNDRLNRADNPPERLVPYRDFTLRNGEPLKYDQPDNINHIKRNNDELNLELLSNGKRNFDGNSESDLSVLHLSSLDDSRNLRSLQSSNNNENKKYTRRDDLDLDISMANIQNSDDDAAVILPTNLETPNLRSDIENQSDKQDTTDTLNLEYPWNGKSSPDDKDSSILPVLHKHKPIKHELGSHLRLRKKTKKQQNEDLKDFELHLEYPWNNEPAPDHDTKESKLRTYRTKNLDNKSSHRRNRNRNRNDNRRVNSDDPNLRVLPHSSSNNEDSIEYNQMDAKSYFRQSDSNHNEFPSYGLENNTYDLTNTDDEDTSSIMSYPLDRRPYTRHRTQEEDRPLDLNRRIKNSLEIASSNSTEVLDSSEEANDSGK